MKSDCVIGVPAHEYVALVEFVADFAGHGLRCDMNPTMCLPDTETGMEAVRFLLDYFGGVVERKVEQAFAVLGLEKGPIGYRTVHGMVEGIHDVRYNVEHNIEMPERHFRTDEEHDGYMRGCAIAEVAYRA